MAKKRKQPQTPDKRSPAPIVPYLEDDGEGLASLAEDCDREMYGDDYEHLRDSGWLDR